MVKTRMTLRLTAARVAAAGGVAVCAAGMTAGGEPAFRVTRELLGEGIHAQTAAWIDGELHITTVENMVTGAGQGENFTHWRRRDGRTVWIKQALFPAHHPGMPEFLVLDGAVLILYVDRQDEQNRRVWLQRVVDGEVVPLFDFADGTRGVLNPAMDLLPDGTLLVLVPNRVGRETRRFIIDPVTGDAQRLDDITMPARGARIFDRLIVGNRLLAPVSVIEELLLLEIDLTDHSYRLHRRLDAFDSIAREPPRNTGIVALPDGEPLALVYLRPAAFSDRTGRRGPATGLIGEIVVNVIETNAFRSLRNTVIAGHTAETAATHNMAIAQTGPRTFLLAHSEVDRIHQRHLTGEHKNYVGGYITHWRIGEDGTPERLSRQDIHPFYGTRMVPDGAGGAHLVCAAARDGEPLHYYRIEPLP